MSPERSGSRWLILRLIVHPSENLDAVPGAAVPKELSGVFFAQLDDPVLWDGAATECSHALP